MLSKLLLSDANYLINDYCSAFDIEQMVPNISYTLVFKKAFHFFTSFFHNVFWIFEGHESQCGFEVFLSTVILHQIIAPQNTSLLKDVLSILLDLLEKNNGVSFLHSWFINVKFKLLLKSYLDV